MSKEMTQREAVRRAWNAAEAGQFDGARAWAAVAAQLPFEQDGCLPLASDTEKIAVPVPRPLERKLIGPPHAHLDAPCTDACYESVVPQQCACGDGDLRGHVHLPAPRRDDPTNVRTPAELEHEAARAALRGEPVPDPRADETVVLPAPRSTAVPRPDSVSRETGAAICMCGVQIYLHEGYGWVHAAGGVACPS